jgi:hypothetical protein
VGERQEELAWLPIFGIAAAAMLGDANESKSLGLTDCRRDLVARYAVVDEVLFRYRQPPIIVAAVIGQLD